MDRNIGRLLAAVHRIRPRGDTLTIFTSDNGATFEPGNLGTCSALDSNAPLRGEKRTLWEGGIRVPTVVAWPGHILAGTVSDIVGQQIDLFPTVLAAAGALPSPSWKVDGLNLLPAWRGETKAPDRTLCWEWRAEGFDQIAAIRGDLKLLVDRGGPPELFDVARDPSERRNLAEERPEIADQLSAQLVNWLGTVRDVEPAPYLAAPRPKPPDEFSLR